MNDDLKGFLCFILLLICLPWPVMAFIIYCYKVGMWLVKIWE